MEPEINGVSQEWYGNKGGKPKVSIGMPVYNGERFIRQALDSLLAQTFTDFELIISDNASTDATQDICLEFVSNDKRIHYYRHEVGIDGGANFNHVLGLANGQYFMWAAHDDLWAPFFVERLTKALDASPRAALAFCRFLLIDTDGHVTRTIKTDWARIFGRPKFQQFIGMTLLDELVSRKANHIYGLMKRDALLDCGGMATFPNTSYSGEDIITLLRLLAKWDFVIVDEVLFKYRMRQLSTYYKEPLIGYFWKRITRRLPGHQGNLLLFFKRNHAFHSNMRRTVAVETRLPQYQKFLLRLAIALKEIYFPLSFLPIAFLREMRILR